MTTQGDHRKRALRAELRERRRNITVAERERRTEQLTHNLLALVQRTGARSLSCYLSTPDEPNTRPFVNRMIADGVRVLFPLSREDGLLDWTDGAEGVETEGLFGISEAVGNILGPIAINDVDLILVPAAAVDERGTRMGWGRGYYDKTLGSMEQCPPVYAVIFDDEVLTELPREPHDIPVGGAVTPSRIIEF